MKNPTSPTWKSEIIPILTVIAGIIFGIYFYFTLPDVVASHWNFKGEVDGYSSKLFTVVFFPIMFIGLYLMFYFLPYFDPKKERYQEFKNIYHIFKTIILFFLLSIFIIVGLTNLGYNINIGKIIPALIGILFIIIGKYMEKIKPNWFLGIRTPWTLSSETVWKKTHRFGSWVFIALGIILLLTPLFPEKISFTIFIISTMTLILSLFIYSLIIYTKEK